MCSALCKVRVQVRPHRSLSVSVLLLQDEQDFRDMITPISVAMEYNLDYQRAADQSGLLPILDASTPNNVTKQVGSGTAAVDEDVVWDVHHG